MIQRPPPDVVVVTGVTVALLIPPSKLLVPTKQTVGVALVKVTSKPESAVALTVVEPPAFTVAGEKPPGVIVWLSLLTVIFCITWSAGQKLSLPA